ncbi:MAG: hypothetical protein HQM03_10290 [Magnetococcales bacterium]|nr:hypothetical protein [Magnetococcales bacterium]
MMSEALPEALSKACLVAIKKGLPAKGTLHNSTPEHVIEQIQLAYQQGDGLCLQEKPGQWHAGYEKFFAAYKAHIGEGA